MFFRLLPPRVNNSGDLLEKTEKRGNKKNIIVPFAVERLAEKSMKPMMECAGNAGMTNSPKK
jgi:hypothetical protein